MGSTAVLATLPWGSLQGILELFDLIVFLAERLKGIDPSKDDLDKAVLFEFAVANNLRPNKQGEEQDSFPGNFKAENGKHCFGL